MPISVESTGPTPTGGRAVILGASMAGLLAARALSESYREVIVVDRDELPDSGPRKGVPQGQHAHALLARGRDILEELFPGLVADLSAQGAVPADLLNDILWFNGPMQVAQAPSDLIGLCVSRPTLENYIRTRIEALSNVTLRPGTEAVRLLASADRGTITGVVLLAQTAEQGLAAEQELTADLVVDATGRGNRGVTWLGELGYPAPAEDVVKAGIVYGTREYVRVDGDCAGVAILTSISPQYPRAGLLLPTEHGEWILTLVGLGDDIPPTDEPGFTGFAARLPVPHIHDVITAAQPTGPARRFRVPASVRRRYERLARLPEGYLAVGDALCAFNPVYGQGMTVAAAEALLLRECVAEGRAGLSRRFFQRAAKIIDIPWDMAVGGDLAHPSVEGKRTLKHKLLNLYIARVLTAAQRDPAVAKAFMEAINLKGGPERLMAPRMLRRVLWPRARPAVGAAATS